MSIRNMRHGTMAAAAGIAAPLHAAAADGYHGHMGGWGMGLGFLTMVLIWGALIAGAVFLFRWLGEQGQGARKTDALETLRQRLARGEIDIEDYEARRKVLEG